MQGDRIGLVAFAGDAFVLCPITLDYGAAKMFLDILDTDIIPTPGTGIGKAIATSLEVFEKTDRKHKVLILLTDGEDHLGKPIDAAELAAADKTKIFTIGSGSCT